MASNYKNNILTGLAGLELVFIFLPILPTYLFSLLMGLVVIFGVIFYPSVLSNKAFILLLIFILIEFMFSLFGSGISVNSIIYTSLLFFSSITISLCIKELTRGQVYCLLFLCLVLLAYTIFRSYIVLLSNPMALRSEAYDVDIIESGTQGLYSYGVGEALAVILPAFLAYSLNAKNRIYMVVLVVIVLCGIITQYMGALTTSFMLSTLFSVIVLISCLFISGKRKTMWIIIAMACLSAFILVSSPSFEENAQLIIKMEDLRDSYSSGHAVGQVGGRAELYKQSFHVCIHNPILGLGKAPVEFGKYDGKTVSMHTSILDYWGLYGLFTLLLLISWKNSISINYNHLTIDQRKYYKWSFYSLVGLLLLKGPVTIGVTFMFSTVILGLIFTAENFRSSDSH